MYTLPQTLFQRWTESHEENTGDVRVYHPGSYDFPPARGRRGIELREDGTFIRYDIAPEDGTMAVNGEWKVLEDGRIEALFPGEPYRSLRFTILSCDEETLRIRV